MTALIYQRSICICVHCIAGVGSSYHFSGWSQHSGCCPHKAEIRGVPLNGEASCPGTVFGAYLVTDRWDSRTEHIRVFASLPRLVQAVIRASVRRSCRDVVSLRQGGANVPFVGQHLKKRFLCDIFSVVEFPWCRRVVRAVKCRLAHPDA